MTEDSAGALGQTDGERPGSGAGVSFARRLADSPEIGIIVALAVAGGVLGRRVLARAPVVVPATAAVVLATAVVHAAFFGAGRYGLVVAPFVAALAFAGRGDRGVEVAVRTGETKRPGRHGSPTLPAIEGRRNLSSASDPRCSPSPTS